MKSIRLTASLFGSVLLVLFFQNCGGVNFNAADMQSTKALGEEGYPFDEINQTDESEGNFIESDDIEDSQASYDEDDEDGGKSSEDISEGLPHEGEDLDAALGDNVACTELFSKLNLDSLPSQDKVRIVGIKGDISVANANELFIAGISKNIAAKNIGRAEIIGIHKSLCLQAEEANFSGIITGSKANVAIIGPDNGLGHADRLTGINRSDLVLVNYEVDQIVGIGRSLHIFGGRVHRLTGIFEEIHLHNGATIDNIQGIKQSVVIH